jgi:cytidylate kinase
VIHFRTAPQLSLPSTATQVAVKALRPKKVAARLGYTYIDSGAMYRAVTLFFLQHRIVLSDHEAVHNALTNIHITFHYNPETICNERT